VTSRDGNGWVRCELGHRHWGRFGAAGLLAYVAEGGPVLLQQRTWWSHHGGTWGLPGGARDSHETVLDAAQREAWEECGVAPDAVRPRAVFTDDHGGWSYTTVLAQAYTPFPVESDFDETADVAWVELGKVAQLSLHPGFAAHWHLLRNALEPLTLIVDGANVMGSRPDGWWRDRAGAARRLRDQLIPLAGGLSLSDDLPAAAGETGADLAGNGGTGRRYTPLLQMTWLPDIVLVVEGAARPVADDEYGAGDDGVGPDEAGRDGAGQDEAGRDGAGRDGMGRAGTGRVQTIAAPASGDDAIAELAASTAGRRIVVTADRELRQRCTAAGAEIAGPGWLLRQLER
jgi:8-oxo-dGTP diphosphatase